MLGPRSMGAGTLTVLATTKKEEEDYFSYGARRHQALFDDSARQQNVTPRFFSANPNSNSRGGSAKRLISIYEKLSTPTALSSLSGLGSETLNCNLWYTKSIYLAVRIFVRYKAFEMSFLDGRSKERFEAKSVKERASWISAIWKVDVPITHNIDGLKKAINDTRCRLFLSGIPNMILLKLRAPIRILPLSTLLQRSRDADSLVELEDPASTVLDEFPEPLVERHVHIIVKGIKPTIECPIMSQRSLQRSNIEEVDELIGQFLDRCRPHMRVLVANANNIPSFLPSWEPSTTESDESFTKHIHELRIPTVSDGQLSLLLHNLGEERSKLDEERARRIPDIFSFAKHTVLVNTSGSGKTRLLLEGLCRRWGFYFVAKPDSVGIGSSDLYHIVNNFDSYQDFERATLVTKGSSAPPPACVQHIRETARRGLCQLLLARFLLLSLLVEEVKLVPQPLPLAKYCRLWTLLQAQPNMVFGTDFRVDVFTEFASLLRPASRSNLEDRIREKYQELSFLLTMVQNPATRRNQKPPFFCVLDEAQITTSLRNGDFFSETFSPKRSVLREIWLSWTSVLNPQQMRLVISGTGINLQLLETSNSPALKPESYQLRHDIGAFEDAEHQAEYIKQYIQVDWMDGSWKEFLNRAWAWFRGRYQSTATLISLVLQAGCRSPHRIINAYVEAFTDFRPTDADDWIMHEPELLFNIKSEVSRLNLDKMNEMQSKTLSENLFDQFLYGSYSLGSFSADERALFVQYGFARHKAGMENTVLDEPLMILAALGWVNKKSHLSHGECLRHDIEKHSHRKNGFEAYFTFYIRKVFETPKKLDEVFRFRSDFAKRHDVLWQSEDFELVTVVATADRNRPRVSVVTPSCGPSSNVGFLAKSGEEVLEWLSTNRGRFTFCFPPESFGPDVLFFIRLIATGQLLLVLAQCKKYNKVAKDNLIAGVRTVTPAWLWKSKNKKHQSIASAPYISDDCAKLAGQTKEILANLPLGLHSGADFPVLRVFASFPGDAGLERTLPPCQITSPDDVDLHPLASLHLDNFIGVNKQLDINWFRGDVQQKEVVYLKRPHNSQESSGQKRTRTEY